MIKSIKKSAMNQIILVFIIILVVAILVALTFLFTSGLKSTTITQGSKDSITNEGLYLTSLTLSAPVTGSSLYKLNDTYLSCDGVDNYFIIYPSSNDTLAFYYNSSTSVNWVYVVNVMGTKYNNSILEDPAEYPVYWNGTAYFFCKTDATTFWEGNIDKISIYDGQLNQTEIEELYNQTRW
jgi:hypothetical protein